MRKNILKTVFIFVILTEVLSLSGCYLSVLDYYMSKTDSQEAEVEQVAAEIAEILSAKDSEKLDTYFSHEALNDPDYEKGKEYAFSLFSGNVVSVERQTGSFVETNYYHRLETTTSRSSFDIVTDEHEYFLIFDYFLIDERNDNTSRISRMMLYPIERINDEVAHSNNSPLAHPNVGIFTPDWDLEEEAFKQVIYDLIDIIAAKDSDKLDTYFTEDALDSPDYEIGKAYTFENFVGNVLTIEDMEALLTPFTYNYDNGKYTAMAYQRYHIITDEKEYVISYDYYRKDTINNNVNKISRLKLSILDADVTLDNYFAATGYSHAGIYNPEWDNENVND